MKKEEKTFIDILLNNNKYLFIKNYLELNKNEILKALTLKASYKSIFKVTKAQTNLNIDYRHFLNILSDFKKKYIYNLSETEYKEQIKAITQEKQVEKEQPKILAAKISESSQPAQPKEQEKIESNTIPACDEKPSDKIPKWKQEGFNSLNEYFAYLQKQPKSIPEEKKGFVYETSIIK